MYINGEWRVTSQKLKVYNPSSGDIAFIVDKGKKKDVEDAINVAANAFDNWSKTPAIKKADILTAIYQKMMDKKEDLAKIISLEMGKPLKDAIGETQSAIDYFRWFSEETRRTYGQTIPANDVNKRIMVIKQPIGVVAAITPWNFPLSMVARKLAPALAAGCTVVLKPSSKSPKSAIEMAKIFEEINLPKGVFNLVIADSNEATEAFMESDKVKKITFTGSTRIGKLLMEKSARTVKRVSMELGGHAPFIVFDDADIEQSVNDLLSTKFRCSGQMCTSTNRIFVQASIINNFTDLLNEKVKNLKVGKGIDDQTNVGPVIDQNAVDKINQQITDAVSKGATKWSSQLDLSDQEQKGYFIEPTILTNVTREMDIFTEETFGPVAPIISFETEEELLNMVNHEKYGLASYLYTENMSRVIRMSEKMEYGMVGVNDPLPFVVQSPFGGMKESGMGKEGGSQGIEDYLVEKSISIKFNE